MENENLYEIVKEYNKYTKKRGTAVGIVINSVIILSAIFVILCILTAQFSGNIVFGIMIGAAAVFFIYVEVSSYLKSRLLGRLPAKKEKFYDEIKLKRLYELSQDEFTEFAFRSIKNRHPDVNIKKDGMFYKADNIYIVFLTLPGKKDISEEKINMALAAGAENIIAVCQSSSSGNIKEKFASVVIDTITERDILADSPEFDYDEPIHKNKIAFDKICNTKTAHKFIKITVMCVILAFIIGMKAYFIGIAIMCGGAGLFMYFMDLRLKARK